MILSILDNDLYKFTMQQAVCRLYPHARAEYELTNRGATPFPPGFADAVQGEIQKMADLALDSKQKKWLARTCPFFSPDYLDFLSAYAFDPAQVSITQEKGNLSVIIRGRWAETILWEVPVMAVISETYFTMTGQPPAARDEIRRKNMEKAKILAENGVSFVDFGTRRRYSAANHRRLLRDMLDVPGHTLAGTSNVHLAMAFGIAPVGTLAHEWIMFHSALDGCTRANALAMAAWTKIYPDVLGIALTDTYTTDNFLEDFTEEWARQFTGVRQDSGDPLAFTRRMLAHYQRLNIDPLEKTIVFSDGLDVDKTLSIHRFCNGRIRDAYGIGTSLTNDVGVTPLNIVIKLKRCAPCLDAGPDTDWQDTVKLSDDPGKHTGETKAINQCLAELDL
ncbi:MAG: nicotinate phosphoribosyltransferase [Desulfobacter sp.]|nr:MAG: nicotinate phosphoribosyltransferase [Desulfobacter sp.]